jgi:hypothetical protein
MEERLASGQAPNVMDFLEKYSLLKFKEADSNLFQIAGFPHYENVSSNILSFYFEKCALVLKTFLNCISIEYSYSIDPVEKVEREERTRKNNRIDIVVYTKKYIIGIENKINAWLYNPIEDYYAYLRDKAKQENKESLLIVLSKNGIESNTKYKNILYKDFSTELKKYYPELLSSLGHRYFFLLTEYIANIDFLEGGYFMNKDFVEIAKQPDNLAKIKQIVSEWTCLRKDLNKMACQIKDDVLEYSKSFGKQEITQDEICATAWFQNCYLPDTKYNVTIEVIVNLDGFEIQIYESGNQLHPEFNDILLGEILSGEEYGIEYPPRVNYKGAIELEEYDRMIKILIDMFNAFDNFIKNKNYCA